MPLLINMLPLCLIPIIKESTLMMSHRMPIIYRQCHSPIGMLVEILNKISQWIQLKWQQIPIIMKKWEILIKYLLINFKTMSWKWIWPVIVFNIRNPQRYRDRLVLSIWKLVLRQEAMEIQCNTQLHMARKDLVQRM